MVTRNPKRADALYNLGIAFQALHRHEDAIESYDKALAINPGNAKALHNRGNVLGQLGRRIEAIASYDRALAIEPEHAPALNNRGTQLQALGRHKEAIASYDKALAIKPDYAQALFNRGGVLRALNRHEEALASFDKLLSIAPDYHYAFGDAAYCRAYLCDWKDRSRTEKRLLNAARSEKPLVQPLVCLAFSDRPADQLACATACIRDRYPATRSRLWKNERYGHDRIRVAYVSADFRDHAVAFLIAGLIEVQDRKKFDLIGVSIGSDTKSAMHSRLVRGFEQIVDVREKSDAEVAQLLRDFEVDIAVDLMGFTTDARPGIFACRPAPIQVNYLGYPGTMGAEYIDYVIADGFVIPKDDQMHYSEKVVYLPDCFQVNDSKRVIAEHTPTRGEVGLPERGFVLCCFNNSYKLTPQFFDIWMRLLHGIEGGVLWLVQSSPTAMRNLCREAKARGVDPDRLIFAPRTKPADYLARYRLADLFLDTLPYNAGTTASDALWAGLPVLTCPGQAFAARMAGSLLHAVGLPELVTNTLEEYEALALRLATDQALLRELRERLARNRLAMPLFDTDRFRRHIESAYRTMWEINQRGETPRSFSVDPIDASTLG